MYATKFKSRRGLAAAAALLLILTFLLSACSKNKDKAADSSAQTTAGQDTVTEAPEETASAGQDETEEAPKETASALEPETESAPVSGPIPLDCEPSLNRTDISFFGPGESFVLVVEDAPADVEILWTAEDEEIASIDETGRVTAVGPGSARVYAEVNNVKLTCWIRCKFDAPASEDDPALDKTDMSFFGVGEFYRLTVINAPEDAEIIWTSEDYSVATVDETGRVTAVGPGTIKVTAEIGETTLSCWVRCQFAAPEMPRSSVADGTWIVTLYKNRITALQSPAGVYTADAALQMPVRVVRDYLESLRPGDDLNLSGFGYGVPRVEAIEFNGSRSECTVKTSTSEYVFELDDSGKWTLIETDTGVPRYYSPRSCSLVFDGNTVCLDYMNATLAGQSEPIHRENVLDFFGKLTGFENEVFMVQVTVKDGVVTEASWKYHS